MAMSGQYSSSVLGASDEIQDIYCEPCQKDGLVALAEGYCKDCPEYLCAQCYRSHRRNKGLANHVLLDKDSMPITQGYNRRVLDICEQKCTIHPDKVIEFFCETCDKLGCHVCVTLDHRQCEKVKHIPDISKNLVINEEFTEFYECIKTATDQLSEFEQKIQGNVTSNKEMQKLAKQELKRQRTEVNKCFDELERKIDDQILKIEKRNKETLKAASDKLEPMKNHLDQIKNDIEAKKSGQNCELFISMKNNKVKMRTFNDQFNRMRKELRIQHYSLLPSEQIHAMIRTTTEICRISTARLQSVIDIKTSKDKTEPSILRLTIMHRHYCVVADNENKSIKVVDTKSKQVTSEIGIEADYIWSMTSVSDNHVVVSISLLGDIEQILFSVSTSGIIQSTNKLYYVDDWYIDMVHCKGNIYALQTNRIDILNMRGKIIRTIKSDDKGAALFGALNKIAQSPDMQTLYVTDGLKHSVTSLTLDGKVKAIYTDKDLQNPGGIAVDKYGYVYVGSRDTHNIHQLTADLNKVQVLIDDVNGWNVAYSSTENKLYTVDNDNINEYSLDFK